MKYKLIRMLVLISWIGVLLFIIGIVIFRFKSGFWPEWTGFGIESLPGKTLWDWLELLIVPAALTAGAFLFNKMQRENERIQLIDQQREAALQAYLDKISDLLLDKKLFNKLNRKTGQEKNVVRAKTVTLFKMLDYNRRQVLIQFLQDSKLSDFVFENASLRKTELIKIDLSEFNLKDIDLSEADLSQAHLDGSNLVNADLVRVKLRRAKLSRSNLSCANLQNADLREADLTGANLSGADLSGADLSGSYLTGAQLSARVHTEESSEKIIVAINSCYDQPAILTGADVSDASFGPSVVEFDRSFPSFPLAGLSGGASLSGVDFSQVNGLKKADFQGAFDDGTAIWPKFFDREAAGLVVPGDLLGEEKAPRAARPHN